MAEHLIFRLINNLKRSFFFIILSQKKVINCLWNSSINILFANSIFETLELFLFPKPNSWISMIFLFISGHNFFKKSKKSHSAEVKKSKDHISLLDKKKKIVYALSQNKFQSITDMDR